MHTGFIPEREFKPIAQSNFVVNCVEIVPDDTTTDSHLIRDLAVGEPRCRQFYDALLAGSRRSVLISKGHGFTSRPSIRVC
jgi:hypothetical protein